MKQFNMNNLVKVKLTESGLKILQTEKEKDQYFLIPKVDEDGYANFPLWKLMNVFGDYLFMGNNDLPFDLDILISDEYLIEPQDKKSRHL